MQQVNQIWLRWYAYVLAITDCVILAIFMANHFIKLPFLQTNTVSRALIIILALHFLFVVLPYRFIERRTSWLANTISVFIFGIFLVYMATFSKNLLLFRILLIPFSFFYAMNGPLLALVGITVSWFIFVINLPRNAATSTLDFTVTAAATVVAGLGWLLFKKHYFTSGKSQEGIHALSELLKDEQIKSGAILESITDGVIAINTQGTIHVLNESAARLLGWPKQEGLNLDYKSLIQPEAEAGKPATPEETAISTCLKTSEPAQKISILKTRHERHIYVDIVASPIIQNIKQQRGEVTKKLVGVIAVLRDVDQQKRQEQQRSDFISTASHEMRTPVASIQGFIELALNPKVASVDQKAREYLEKAHNETKHLGQLFQDLLTVSKSEDGHLSSNPKLINIGEFLQEAAEREEMAASKKNLKIVLEQAATDERVVTPLLYVYADPERLREVVTNLVDNAIKYTSAGVVTIGASMKEQGVVIRVSDTGMGIAEEDIPHLFQKFYRTDNSATREIGGTGLGLYICRQIVEMMHGRIWVESTIGAGSTFFVELPRVTPEKIEQLRSQNLNSAPTQAIEPNVDKTSTAKA